MIVNPRAGKGRGARAAAVAERMLRDTGAVVSQSDFAKWLQQQRVVYGPVMRYLPKYATSYTPDPQLRAG